MNHYIVSLVDGFPEGPLPDCSNEHTTGMGKRQEEKDTVKSLFDQVAAGLHSPTAQRHETKSKWIEPQPCSQRRSIRHLPSALKGPLPCGHSSWIVLPRCTTVLIVRMKNSPSDTASVEFVSSLPMELTPMPQTADWLAKTIVLAGLIENKILSPDKIMDDQDSFLGPTPLTRFSQTSLPGLGSMHSAIPGVSRT